MSLAFLAAVYRVWPAASRKPHNDILGWQLSVVGTVYAVILGFMLYTVWTDFGLAQVNVDRESSALLNVYRLADGLPEPQRTELRNAAKDYTEIVVNQDWPMMADSVHNHLPSHAAVNHMFSILTSIKGAGSTQGIALDHAFSELSEAAQDRRMRETQSNSKLPGVLWFVLIVGAMVTVLSCCLFGCPNAFLHAMQVAAFSLLIALVLTAIIDIDRPFQGAVHVSSGAFNRVRLYMSEQ